MKKYKIIIKLDDAETPVITIEAKNWEDVANYVFGNIEIVDLNEK